MKFTAITCAALSLALYAEQATAWTCYNGLAQRSSDIDYHVVRACKGYDGKRGLFQDQFAPGEGRVACPNLAPNKHVHLEIKNENRDNAYTLREQDCVDQFRSIIGSCRALLTPLLAGGYGSVAGWFYKYVLRETWMMDSSDNSPRIDVNEGNGC